MKIICLYRTRGFNSFIAFIEPFYAGDHIHEFSMTLLPSDIEDIGDSVQIFETYHEAIRYAEILEFGQTNYK